VNPIEKSKLILMENEDYEYYLTKGIALFGLTRDRQNQALRERNAVMCEIRDLADLIIKLESRGKIFDGNKKWFGTNEKKFLLDDIFRVGMLWQAENLGNEFYIENNNYFMKHNYQFKNGRNSYLTTEIFPILNNGKINIKNLDKYGLPSKLGDGDLDYYHPQNKSVARFFAYSDRAYLNCNWDPASSDAELGVRAKIFKKFN